MIGKLTSRLSGMFYGWWMVALACSIRMVRGSFHRYGFTILFRRSRKSWD